MDTSDEEDFALLLLAEEGKEIDRTHRSVWVRHHFQLRSKLGEFHTTFQSLMDHPDETLFFNYMRMSYESYQNLKDLILPHIQPVGSNWRPSISGEEKLVITIR